MGQPSAAFFVAGRASRGSLPFLSTGGLNMKITQKQLWDLRTSQLSLEERVLPPLQELGQSANQGPKYMEVRVYVPYFWPYEL